MKKILSRTLALAGVSLLAATMFAAPANAVAAPPAPTSTTAPAPLSLSSANVPDISAFSGDLTPAEQKKVASNDPLTIVVNVKTGMIKKIIEPSAGPVMQPLSLIVSSTCVGAQGCYYSGGAPYADFGFTTLSSGTQTGNWAHRTGYGSKTRTVSVCTIYGCYGKAGPNRLVAFDQSVTGTSFTIY